jgi:co-chaperonin GroES (HSP10)
MKLKPHSDWILVQCENFKAPSDIIHSPNTDSSHIRLGKILAVGPGKYQGKKAITRTALGVDPGEKIAFLRWHQEHRPGKSVAKALHDLSDELGADVCMVRANDILFVFEGDVRVTLP